MITLHHTTRTEVRAEVILPCARCKRLATLAERERIDALGLWVCRDRHACWFAVRENARIAAALRADGEAAA